MTVKTIPMENSLIPNTTMAEKHIDDVLKAYAITPQDGYKLHDNLCDNYTEYDQNGNGIGEPILGFYFGTRTVKSDYDFGANPREFYAVPESANADDWHEITEEEYSKKQAEESGVAE